MEIIYKDLKKNEFKIRVTDKEDYWYLENFIDKGDIVHGIAERRIQLDSDKSKSFRKKFHLEIIVEKIEDGRILGKITNSKYDEVPNGEHQSINLVIGTIITIKKKDLFEHQLEYLNEASQTKKNNILVMVLERDNATFALMTKKGYKILSDIEGDVEKKEERIKITGKNFYETAKEMLNEYVKRYEIDKILLGSPAFWKEEFAKILDENIKKKIIFVNCNNTGRNGIYEVIRRPETKKMFGELRIAKEEEAINRFLSEVKKDGNIAYGFNEVKEKSEIGSIKELLISSKFIQKEKEKGEYDKIRKIMKNTSMSNGKMIILNSENEAGKQLDGFGGIAALLRWK